MVYKMLAMKKNQERSNYESRMEENKRSQTSITNSVMENYLNKKKKTV